NDRSGAGTIFHHHGLVEPLRRLVRQGPTDNVVAAARPDRHDDLDWPRLATEIAPTGLPSRSMGTASPLRQFPASANSCEYSGSARRSGTWAMRPSNTARPASTKRSGRFGYVWKSFFRTSGVKLWVAASVKRSPSYRKTKLNIASHRRAAL